ncbi:hypothetical protein AMECASPLE_031293 [Ameca splendens]|uniref:Uncharacterized protein n=1 Tax=Ameca splendens TaxID=208324 RepID=A0ABV0XJ86_9TELE
MLQQMGIQQRSEMRVRRICAKHKLTRKVQVSDAELEMAVLGSIYETGPYVRSHVYDRIFVVEGSVGRRTLSRTNQQIHQKQIHQPYHEYRRQTCSAPVWNVGSSQG